MGRARDVQISQLQNENASLCKTNVSNYKLQTVIICNVYVFDSSVSLFTRHENVLIFCSDDTLKASYLQLKAASNEKQSVDTVDTGVQADYLAVAPG